MSTDIRQDVEKILKELIVMNGGIHPSEWWSEMLFYKINGKIYYEDAAKGCGVMYRDTCVTRNLAHKVKRLVILNPEYIFYVGYAEYFSVDGCISKCINIDYGSYFPDFVSPLVPVMLYPDPQYISETEVFRAVFDTDPLTQVLDYVTLKRHSDHLYICPRIHFVSYSNGDLSYLSIGSAKHGVVAYCTTFCNYMYKILSGQWRLLNKELESIRQHIIRKLEDYGKQLLPLPREERKKYCNVHAIKDLVSKEIEEADKLMKQNGIIRVTFPLDQHYV